MSLYERLFPRFRPKRELRPQGSGDGWGARITWLGTAGFVIQSAETTLLVDPFLTRPGLSRIARRMIPDDLAIARHVPRKVDAVLCGHSHYDHVADAPRIAKRALAKLVGSPSTCAWGRAEGLPESQLVQIPKDGALVRFGDIEVRYVPSRHGKIAVNRVPLVGEVRTTPRGPGRLWHYRMGGAFGLLIKAPGVTIYHNGSADLIVLLRAPGASVITPDYEEPICVPPNDARGAVLAAS